MDLKKEYEKINESLGKIDFKVLCPGFKPLKFALYDKDSCFFDGRYIAKTDEFFANTAILYNGEYIAIWNMGKEIPVEEAVSKIVHEMFHGFQRINNEARFPNELEALTAYRYQDENLSLKLHENELLVSLLKKFEHAAFSEFLKIRKYRFTRYSFECTYESMVEQIEGTAAYIELMALKQLSKPLYLEKLGLMQKRITDKNCFFPIRIISYDIGALILTVLNANGISFDASFGRVPFSLKMIEQAAPEEIRPELCFSQNIAAYYKNAGEIIENAITKNNVVEDRPFELLDVNVYDAACLAPYIITSYFVTYSAGDGEKTLDGDFVIEMDNKSGKKIYMI